ncbi:hypothetical protein ZOSMA_2G02930 [Zostera marina]|uniref:Uncharacterized protein n=1 Tax=Zostera marina TaxID=29655 RepID=A0A0K9PBE6_ZOSMR|nr:hypothetical protein ZOSMA_2G02930 [Zostera marina]
MFIYLFAFAGFRHVGAVRYFDVIDYGAKFDGVNDSSHAFMNAWKDACQNEGMAQVSVPLERISLVQCLSTDHPNEGLSLKMKE